MREKDEVAQQVRVLLEAACLVPIKQISASEWAQPQLLCA
jgi:hypothetical protein